jgi:carboxymethylenebutenolidase
MKKLRFFTAFMMLSFAGIIVTGQDFAVKQLEDSPRHHEWVDVKSGDRQVNCFVVYPEKAEKTLSVIVIHENRGLTDWVRSFADQLAAAGYLAIAPDLLSGYAGEFKKTSDYPTTDDAKKALYQLDPEQITKDLEAVQQYISQDASSNGKTLVMGFCWGGSQSFRFATNNNKISAACVFYGSPPKSEAQIQRIEAPVYGFYGENDQRINATIPQTEEWMKKHDKTYDYEIYKGAGHAYMRRGDDPEGSAENKKARDDSWKRIKKLLQGF